ncbi:MAG: hypothetical protein EOP34_11580 [Rickettsiales bacterium]|nr:MAG: hypothetical protein EOP34_11580 [Rickettsiales bacterium]
MIEKLKKYIKESNIVGVRNIVSKYKYLLSERDETGDLPMHYAAKNWIDMKDTEYTCKEGDITYAIAELISDDDDDINITGADGNTILDIAIARNNKKLELAVVEIGGKRNSFNRLSSKIENIISQHDEMDKLSFVKKIKSERSLSFGPCLS